MSDLEKYLYKDFKDKLTIALAFIIFGASSAVLIFVKQNYIVGAILSLASLLLLYLLLFGQRNDKKYLNELKIKGELELIEKDFQNAKSYAEDRLRLGNTYIFRKKLARIITYEDIVKADYYERLDNNNEALRTEYGIHLKLKNNCHEILCELYEGPYEEASIILEELVKHNPLIEIKL